MWCDGEVAGEDDVVVQAAEDDGVHDDGAEFFDQVEGEAGAVVGDLVQAADVGVESDGADGGFEVVGEDGVAEGEEGVDGVGRGRRWRRVKCQSCPLMR